jgi:hypothetical protein
MKRLDSSNCPEIPSRMWHPARGQASTYRADAFFELEPLFKAICELLGFLEARRGIG